MAQRNGGFPAFDSAMVLEPDAYYETDNGAIYHGRCCGASARFTGRDISGRPVVRVSDHEAACFVRDLGLDDACEACNARHHAREAR